VDPSFRELFTFTSGEKKGLLILTGIIVLLLLILLLLPFILREGKGSDSEWIKEMSRLDLKINESTVPISDSIAEEDEVNPGRELFEFDPNLATEQNFKALGLTSWQIKIIDKFRKKGGRFRTKEDFGKIYSIGRAQLEILEPYIHIQSNLSTEKNDSARLNYISDKVKNDAGNFMIEINSCDSNDLYKLNGIGKILAARIIKYRDRLGGFVRLDQLLEIYGLRTETFSGLLIHLRIDTTLVRKLKLNSMEYRQLKQHPYLTPFQAKSIIKYRELKGFKGLEDLEKYKLLMKEDLEKIRPYLSLE